MLTIEGNVVKYLRYRKNRVEKPSVPARFQREGDSGSPSAGPARSQFGAAARKRGGCFPIQERRDVRKHNQGGTATDLAPVTGAGFYICRGRCPHRPGRTHCFFSNLRRIRNFPVGRCGHRPLQSLGEFVLLCKFRTQGVFTADVESQLLPNSVYRNRRRVP